MTFYLWFMYLVDDIRRPCQSLLVLSNDIENKTVVNVSNSNNSVYVNCNVYLNWKLIISTTLKLWSIPPLSILVTFIFISYFFSLFRIEFTKFFKMLAYTSDEGRTKLVCYLTAGTYITLALMISLSAIFVENVLPNFIIVPKDSQCIELKNLVFYVLFIGGLLSFPRSSRSLLRPIASSFLLLCLSIFLVSFESMENDSYLNFINTTRLFNYENVTLQSLVNVSDFRENVSNSETKLNDFQYDNKKFSRNHIKMLNNNDEADNRSEYKRMCNFSELFTCQTTIFDNIDNDTNYCIEYQYIPYTFNELLDMIEKITLPPILYIYLMGSTSIMFLLLSILRLNVNMQILK